MMPMQQPVSPPMTTPYPGMPPAPPMAPAKPSRGLAAAALVVAILALALGPLTAYLIGEKPGPQGLQGPAGSQGPAGPTGPTGPPGTGSGAGFSGPYIWGHATVTDCGIAPDFIEFVVRYINVGNATASNVVANYVVYQFEDPTIIATGAIAIGTVARLSSGEITHTVTTLECGLWGHAVDVTFAWT